MKPSVEIEGFVLSIQDYKENDGILTLLTPNGILSILAKGIQKQTSKNRAITQVFSKVRYTIDERKNGLSLLYYGQTLKSNYRIMEDLMSSSLCFVLCECIQKTKDEKIYDLFDLCLDSLQNQEKESYLYACMILKEILSHEGVSPYVDGCVLCHRQNHIETISLEEGGFLCAQCNHARIQTWSKEELIKFRCLFKAKPKDIEVLKRLYEYTIDDFIYLVQWFEKHMHIKISSCSFLKTILPYN